MLPAADAPDVPSTAPACPSLRNQPCRDYLPARVATDVQLAQNGDDRFDVQWTAPERGGQPDHYLVTTGPAGAPTSTPLSLGSAKAPAAVATTTTAVVAGDATSFSFAAQPDVAYVATVQAVYADGRRAGVERIAGGDPRGRGAAVEHDVDHHHAAG